MGQSQNKGVKLQKMVNKNGISRHHIVMGITLQKTVTTFDCYQKPQVPGKIAFSG
jgi:hypothetical protein